MLKGLSAPPRGEHFVSVITRMELYAKPDLSDEERKNIDHFLSGATVLPLDSRIEPLAIDIRRFGKPRPKLPDDVHRRMAMQ
jgi:predicted nucleic acid-binding protein